MNVQQYMRYLSKRFLKPFTENYVPEWSCPHCQMGYLQLMKDKLHYSEVPKSIARRKDIDWEPEWADYRFSAQFRCSRCDAITYACGAGKLNYYPKDEVNDEDWEEIEFFPKYFEPSISMFVLPRECPDFIRQVVESAFSVARADVPAAGNRLRVAVEKLVFDLEPKLTGQLDNKIKKLQLTHPEPAKLLMAVKWLGNEASHDDSLRECDLAFAFDVMKAVLEEIYSNERKELDELGDLINSKKGPPDST